MATTKPLRAWLRANPQPARIRVRTEDDEERFIELTDNVRHRWTSAEEAILAARAVVVECIDKKGAILRARELERPETEDSSTSSSKAVDLVSYRDKFITRERAELAAFAKEIMNGCNTAFDRGRDAANSQQEAMMTMLDTITQSYTAAIQNLHNVSVNFANLLTETAGNSEGEKGDMLSQVMSLIAARNAAGAGGAGGAKPPPNGSSQ